MNIKYYYFWFKESTEQLLIFSYVLIADYWYYLTTMYVSSEAMASLFSITVLIYHMEAFLRVIWVHLSSLHW